MTTVVTILLCIGIGITFYYTARSSIKHNDRIIEWLKKEQDNSGNYIL